MRILIVDDHEVVRRGVRSLLSAKKGVEVCGEAVDGRDAIAKAQELKPDVITMDISMPNLNGLEATREIRRILPGVQILILSQHDVPEMMKQALNAGANGYVVKTALSTELVAALDKVWEGRPAFDTGVDGSSQANFDTKEIQQRSSAFEKALQESRDHLALALEASNTAFFEWDLLTRRGKWNSQMSAIYGFTPENGEITDDGWRRLFHPDDRGRLIEEAERVFRKDGDFQFEFRALKPDGALRWILSKGRVIRDPEGAAVRLIGTHTDITDRKVAEEGVAARARQQRALFEFADRLHRAKSPDEVYSAALDAISGGLQCHRSSILLYDAAGVMRFVGWRGLSDAYRKATEGHSLWTRNEPAPVPICVNDVEAADLEDSLKKVVMGEGIRALAFVPLFSRGQLIGKFVLYYDAPHTFTLEDVELSLTIAHQLAFGIERKRAERALRESEERFRAIVEATPDCVKLVAPDGRLLHMNSSGLEMVGANCLEMVVGKSIYELIAQEDRDKYREFNERICRGEKGSLEFDMVSLNGSVRHMEVHSVPLWNPDGTVVQLGVTRDVTQSKSLQRALTEKARLLDMSYDAILVRDSKDRIRFWNDGATELYGFSREEALGRVSHDLLRTVFPEPLEQIRGKFLRDGRWSGELLHTRADGSKITVSTRWSLERDGQGHLASILESNRDIGEREQAEMAQYRLAAIVESSDDAIVSKDLNGIITSWNAGAQRIFGFTPEEAIGKSINLVIPPELQGEEKQILAKMRKGERVEHFETIRRTKSGDRKHISLTISPVRDARGKIIGASKIARDVTQRKQTEHLLKEAELAGRLLQLQDEERRRIARELHDGAGQLLAALGMNISAIAAERNRLSPDVARCAEENLQLINQAVAEIRTLSHLLHPPFLDEVGLKSALTEYVEGFAERSNIRVDLQLPDGLERLPREYELSLFRIVQECLTNIHRHSGSATAQVRLTLASGEIQLEVSDQGRGIDEETQAKFFAGNSAGVGLRGMRERVRQIGGALQLQSNSNGTSLLVILPVAGHRKIDDRIETQSTRA